GQVQIPKAKAFLCKKDGLLQRVEFHFNPTTLSLSKGTVFSVQPQQGGTSAKQFLGTSTTTLSMQILLDAVEQQPEGSVQKEVEQLLAWTNVEDATLNTSSPSPPELLFNWGALSIGEKQTFTGHLKDLKVSYEMFARDGQPIRARADITLESTEQVVA